MSHTLLQHCYLQQFILVSRNIKSNIYGHVQNLDVTGRGNIGNTSKAPAYFSLIKRKITFSAYRMFVKRCSIFLFYSSMLNHYTCYQEIQAPPLHVVIWMWNPSMTDSQEHKNHVWSSRCTNYKYKPASQKSKK